MRTESIHDIYHRDMLRETTPLIVSLACLWEARSRKIGNVHPGASFHDLSYADFMTSAAILASSFTRKKSLGGWIEYALDMNRLIVGKNTNLGIVLLLSPLLRIEPAYHPLTTPPNGGEYQLRSDVETVLGSSTEFDTKCVYRAIRAVNPGGLGQAPEQDVDDEPTVTLLEAMKLAADRDLIARQYANNYADVFDLGVPALLEGFAIFGCVEAAVIHCQLKWMSLFPDSLIVRKLGPAAGEAVRQRVIHVLQLGGLETAEGRAAGIALDAQLRSDGNKLNPGTTADLVCACLFIALREGKLKLNAPFPWTVEDWL